MIQGKHQLRWQFNSASHTGLTPIRFSLDNGDYDRNFVIESFEIIYGSMDKGTNNTTLSGNVHNVVLALTEQGAMPLATSSVNNRPYAIRLCDRRQIAWGMMNDDQIHTILDPHNIVSQDLWLNAWRYGSAHDAEEIDQDIAVLITLNEVKQSGSRALLQAVRDDPLN